jgi:hypothetical protein
MKKPTQIVFVKGKSVKELEKRLAVISEMQRCLGEHSGTRISKKPLGANTRDSIRR